MENKIKATVIQHASANASLLEQGVDVIAITDMSDDERTKHLKELHDMLEKRSFDQLIHELKTSLSESSFIKENEFFKSEIRDSSLTGGIDRAKKNNDAQKLRGTSNTNNQPTTEDPLLAAQEDAVQDEINQEDVVGASIVEPEVITNEGNVSHTQDELFKSNPETTSIIDAALIKGDAAHQDIDIKDDVDAVKAAAIRNESAHQQRESNDQSPQRSAQASGGGGTTIRLFPNLSFSRKKAETKEAATDPASVKGEKILDPSANAHHQADGLRKKGVDISKFSDQETQIFNRELTVKRQARAESVVQTNKSLQDSEASVNTAFKDYQSIFPEALQKELSSTDSQEGRKALVDEAVLSGSVNKDELNAKTQQVAQAISNYEGKIIDAAKGLTEKGQPEDAESLADRFKDKVTKGSEDSFFKDSQPKDVSERLQKLSEDVGKAIAAIISKLFSCFKSGDDEDQTMRM